MTVCFFIGSLTAGGAERQIATLARALARRGVLVHLLCLRLDGSFGHYLPLLEGTTVTVHDLNEKKFMLASARMRMKSSLLPDSVKTLPLDFAYVYRLIGALRCLTPDILHCYLDLPNCLGGCAAGLAGVPGILLSCRSLNPAACNSEFAAQTYPVYRFLLTHTRAALEANSAQGAASYAAWLDIPEAIITVNPNGIDTAALATADADACRNLRRSLGLGEDTPVVLYLSRHASQKNPDLMLAVAARLRTATPDAHILAVGTGLGTDGEIAARVRKLGLTDCVHLLGVRNDVATLLAAADVLLLTSNMEGFPNAIMEAMYAGLPVVATNVGGVPELVRDGVDGFLHSVSDVQGMADSLVRLLGDPALRQSLGAKGRARILHNFTVDKLAERTLARYASLLQNQTFTEAVQTIL